MPYNTPSGALLTMEEDHPGLLAPVHRYLYALYCLKALLVQRRGGSINTDSVLSFAVSVILYATSL